jgi:hypothetical protein
MTPKNATAAGANGGAAADKNEPDSPSVARTADRRKPVRWFPTSSAFAGRYMIRPSEPPPPLAGDRGTRRGMTRRLRRMAERAAEREQAPAARKAVRR